jgi:hypothetical protein
MRITPLSKHSTHLPIQVDEWPSTVSRVDGSISLDVVKIALDGGETNVLEPSLCVAHNAWRTACESA